MRTSIAMKKTDSPINDNDSDKKPLDQREYPLARDSRGKPNREEVRKIVRVPAPRAPGGGGARGR